MNLFHFSLQNIARSPLPYFPGIFQVADYRDIHSRRLISTYETGRREKKRLIDFLNLGEEERKPSQEKRKTALEHVKILTKPYPYIPKQWEWHHIVEKNHLAPLVPPKYLAILYKKALPCVLIHQQEHRNAYGSLFRIRETKLFYLQDTQPDAYLKKLISLYYYAYEKDQPMQHIALNVCRGIYWARKKRLF